MSDYISEIVVLTHPFFSTGLNCTEISMIVDEERIKSQEMLFRLYHSKLATHIHDKEKYAILVGPPGRGAVPYIISETYDMMSTLFSDRFTFFYGSVDKEAITAKLCSRIDKDKIRVEGIGEYTSGCVMDDVRSIYEGLNMNIDLDMILNSLNPDIGVDFKGGYPSIFDGKLSDLEHKERIEKYRAFVKNRFEDPYYVENRMF